jgi:hypothetical protein
MVIDYGLDSQSLIPGRSRGFLSLLSCPDQVWGPPSLLCYGYLEGGVFFSQVKQPEWNADHSF